MPPETNHKNRIDSGTKESISSISKKIEIKSDPQANFDTLQKEDNSVEGILNRIKGRNTKESTGAYLSYFRNILRNEGIPKEEWWLLKKINNFYNHLTKGEELTDDTKKAIGPYNNEVGLARIVNQITNYIKSNLPLLRGKKGTVSIKNWKQLKEKPREATKTTKEFRSNLRANFDTLQKEDNSIEGILSRIKGRSTKESTGAYLSYFRNILRNEGIPKEEWWLLKKINNFYNHLTKGEELTDDTKKAIGPYNNEVGLARIVNQITNYIKSNLPLLRGKRRPPIYSTSEKKEEYTTKELRKSYENRTTEKKETKVWNREQLLEKIQDKEAIKLNSYRTKEITREISNVSKEEALGTIPKELYEKYIKKFLESPEVKNLGIERDKLLRLINQIDSKTNPDPDLAKLRKVRENDKDIQTMIDENQEKQSEILKEKTEEITLESWKKVFKKLGIKISKGEVKQWNYKFIDANNPNISYYFKVETGEFFISNPELSQQTKTLNLWWERFRKFLKIPGYTELMSQALWHKYLPTERPDTEKELYKTIEKNLRNRIMYTIGDTEVIATKDIIERRQLESTIIAKIKSGLDIRKNTVTATNDLWYYEILAPILRTFQQPNLSIDQLKTLKVFADRISEKGQSNDGKTGSAEDIVSYENFRKEITTPRKLIKYALSWEQTRELANLQWTSKKSKFAIGMFMQWLETSTGAGWKENRVIDTEKLNALLNTRDSPDLANRWKYQSSYNELLTTLEASYLKKVEPTVRKQEVAYADNVILPKIQNTPA